MSVLAGSDRRAELRTRLGLVRERIEAACQASGRLVSEITLVVVTKTYPASDLALLAGLGVRDIGENRDQEAAVKHADCADLPLRWHFVGRLQTNKARSVARYADLVHSVDRPALARALGAAAHAAGRRLACLIQISLDADPARGGALPADLPALADAIAGQDALELRGVMAVAPLGVDPRSAFAILPGLRDQLRRAHPDADIISAGMSGDLEAAVAEGATHLRVGTAILGPRPALGYRPDGG
jgi:pyridoxal phosphate enzyme (YggS family)